eukprot:scaffold35625_cov23-Prasinocladus_malaysianus.AAC.1
MDSPSPPRHNHTCGCLQLDHSSAKSIGDCGSAPPLVMRWTRRCSAVCLRRFCSDYESGILHNPLYLGGWGEAVPSGPGAPNADLILYVAANEVPDCHTVRRKTLATCILIICITIFQPHH